MYDVCKREERPSAYRFSALPYVGVIFYLFSHLEKHCIYPYLLLSYVQDLSTSSVCTSCYTWFLKGSTQTTGSSCCVSKCCWRCCFVLFLCGVCVCVFFLCVFFLACWSSQMDNISFTLLLRIIATEQADPCLSSFSLSYVSVFSA